MRVNLNKCQIFYFGVNQPFNAKANFDIFWYATTLKPHHLRDIISAIDNFSKSKQRFPNQLIQLFIKLIPNMTELMSFTINQKITNKHTLTQTSSSTKCYLSSHVAIPNKQSGKLHFVRLRLK